MPSNHVPCFPSMRMKAPAVYRAVARKHTGKDDVRQTQRWFRFPFVAQVQESFTVRRATSVLPTSLESAQRYRSGKSAGQCSIRRVAGS